MLKLLDKNIYNRKLNEDEMLQMGFDKKNGVERIFAGNEEIYFERKTEKFYKTGTLFLDYLSDEISELYNEFINDICNKKNIQDLKDKYISLYTFYFKYFFNDYEENIKLLEEEKLKDLNNRVIEGIKRIETTKTVDDLFEEYKRVYIDLTRGKSVRNTNTGKNIRKNEPIKDIVEIFLDIAYIKQVYKLLVEYCYFRNKTIETKKQSHKIRTRFLYFKQGYEGQYIEIKETFGYDMIPECSLSFFLPPSIASVNADEGIWYTYLLDESINNLSDDILRKDKKAKTVRYLKTFFSVSLLELLETDRKVAKCKNCNRYFVLVKEGTNYCNNPAPQNNNKTCSTFMKAKNYKVKSDNNEIIKERKRALDRTRIFYYHYSENKINPSEKIEEWRQEEKQKRSLYETGEISEKEYLKWLKNSNRTRRK